MQPGREYGRQLGKLPRSLFQPNALLPCNGGLGPQWCIRLGVTREMSFSLRLMQRISFYPHCCFIDCMSSLCYFMVALGRRWHTTSRVTEKPDFLISRLNLYAIVSYLPLTQMSETPKCIVMTFIQTAVLKRWKLIRKCLLCFQAVAIPDPLLSSVFAPICSGITCFQPNPLSSVLPRCRSAEEKPFWVLGLNAPSRLRSTFSGHRMLG